jgi:hypothetical protein
LRKNTVETCAERLRERSKVTPTGCMEWQGAKHWKGYGVLNLEGVSEKAHRVAYIAAHGSIPAGMHALHRCDNRACVNAEHLFLGTNEENIADKVAKDRASKRLTLKKALEIKGMIGTTTQGEIARLYGIAQSTVSRIASGQRRPALAGRV